MREAEFTDHLSALTPQVLHHPVAFVCHLQRLKVAMVGTFPCLGMLEAVKQTGCGNCDRLVHINTRQQTAPFLNTLSPTSLLVDLYL